MANQAKPAVVVTGASTGIGYSIAQRFTQKGWQVFGSVRKPEDGERLRRELGVTPLVFDVTDHAAVDAAVPVVAAAIGNVKLRGLVNNAGLVVAGPLTLLPLDKLRYQFEVNIVGPAKLTQAFAPLLGTDRARTGQPGRIAQISSVAGNFGLPFLGAYVASKHALQGMSESLRRELLLYGIDVSVIAPGAIATPIWGKTELSGLEQYEATDYAPALRKLQTEMDKQSRIALPPERVADAVWHALADTKPKVRYEVIPNKFREWTVPRLLPKRTVDRAVGKMLGLLKK